MASMGLTLIGMFLCKVRRRTHPDIAVDGLPDAHPEAIHIGRPLDGTRLPRVPIGRQLTDITGIVTYQV